MVTAAASAGRCCSASAGLSLTRLLFVATTTRLIPLLSLRSPCLSCSATVAAAFLQQHYRGKMEWEPLPPRQNQERHRRFLRQRVEGRQEDPAVATTGSTTTTTVHMKMEKEDDEESLERAKQNVRQKKPKPVKKQNRPGYNSYLQVVLDDATLDRLHNMTLEIARRCSTLEQQQQQQENGASKSLQKQPAGNDSAASTVGGAPGIHKDTGEEGGDDDIRHYTDSKATEAIPEQDEGVQKEEFKHNVATTSNSSTTLVRKTEKPVPVRKWIQPRSRHSLHMTLFFGGETLADENLVSSDDLIAWHAAIRHRLAQSGFVLQQQQEEQQQEQEDKIGENQHAQEQAGADELDRKTVQVTNKNDKNDQDDFWFRVQEVKCFPPRRNNLIVAILEASPSWHALHNDIRTVAQQSTTCPALREVCAYSKPVWTAHITLANISLLGRNNHNNNNKKEAKARIQQLNQILEDITKEAQQQQQQEQLSTSGLVNPEQTQGVDDKSGSQDAAVAAASMGTAREDEKGDKQRKSVLSSSLLKSKNEPYMFLARTAGIAMGGPIPHQAVLDWDFRYRRSPRIKNDDSKEPL